MGAGSPGPGIGSGSGSGGGMGGSGSGGKGVTLAAATGSAIAPRTTTLSGSDNFTSHSQQSLHRRHFSQRWLSQASLVHRAQIRVDSSPQMLQVNGMRVYFFLPVDGGEIG